MISVGVRRSEHTARRTSPWRLIAYECVAAASCAVVIGLITTALDFGAKMPLASGPAFFARPVTQLGALVLLGIFVFVAVRLQQIVGVLRSAVWKREQ